MPTYEEIPVTERIIICDNCGYSVMENKNHGFERVFFGIPCIVCRKEGCTRCISEEHFFVDNEKQSHHKTCELTGELKELKLKCEREIAKHYRYDPEPDPHGR